MITETHENQVRVLIVDDEEDDFILTSAQINDITSRKFTTEWCPNYKLAIDRIRESKHDIYFVDYRLGVKTGLDLLREPLVRESEEPIILLTGLGSEFIDLEAMRLGAADYLIKSELNPEKLDRCIRYCLERAATLKASRASERKYRSIFERTRDAIFIADNDLTLRNINEAASELLGADSNSLLGTSLYDIITDENEKLLLAETLRDRGDVEDFQISLAADGPAPRIALVSASIELDSRGQSYVQGIIHDITLFKKTEEIRLQAERLEAKGQVIRTLAHEIRNPLNNISVSIDQIKMHITSEATELLRIVMRGVKRIDKLISELMDSAQYVKMNFAVYPLQTVVDKALEGATDRIILKKIKLRVSYPTSPALALVDLEKIKMALLNIILNAVEAMDADKGVLEIAIQSTDGVNAITIKDNGSGMSKEVANRLFEPYFTSKPNGVGIGLATTHAIIESHKGSIDVLSSVGQGTTFTISFPALKQMKRERRSEEGATSPTISSL